MLSKKVVLLGVCALLVLGTYASADTVNILATADTFFNEQAPDNIQNTQADIQVKAKGGGDDRHGLLQFDDLSALSGLSSSDITSAYLQVNVWASFVGNEGGIAAHKILAPGAYTTTTVTWNNWGSAPGGTSGTDYVATALDSTGDINAAGWLTTELDVTQLVKDWLDAPASNYGVVLKGSDGGNTLQMDQGIGGSGTPANTPRLAVDYVPEPMTMAFLALSGLGLLLRRRRA